MHFKFLVAVTALAAAAPAAATDDNFEFWVNPAIAADLDDDTGVELETVQRYRRESNGPDTYYARLWLHQEMSSNATISGAVEHRVNDGGPDETRLHQQLSLRSGIWRGRFRLEQRFIENADRMGLRLRTRGGVAIPIGNSDDWSLDANVEAQWTLRSPSLGGQDGLTGLRTYVGVGWDVSDRLSLGLGYQTSRDVRNSARDTLGHAPLITLDISL